MRTSPFNVRTFGAVGDGATDDTAAIQAALDEAAKQKAPVWVPSGEYLVGGLRVSPYSGLIGEASWAYQSPGGSILKLNSDTATALLDLSGARGAIIQGMSLIGDQRGEGIHGIYCGPVGKKPEEDGIKIESCHIARFTGDGIRLDPIWCFRIRHCEAIFNRGNGLSLRGWDGFILDNWFSSNQGAGIATIGENAACTLTGNRIEWNHQEGIRILGGGHYNLTGNYIDRSGRAGIYLGPGGTVPSFGISATGNVIYRSGKPDRHPGELDSAHARFEHVHGLTFTGNTLCIGQNDGGGEFSPQYGIVARALKYSVIQGNAMHIASLKALVHDLGEHGEGVILKDNPGSLYLDDGSRLWASSQL